MVNQTVIEVSNLSKKFELRHPLLNSNNELTTTLWALNDVSFKVNKGETIGIIGPNGSGKSTLLKILSGITKPTSGTVKINGRVASILDIGAGFHPELTGKENIFLNGQLLGFTKQETKSKYDEIVDFSGIEKFIAEPVKNYSNGMYLRLAFSIMAHLDFDIYLFDEVMSVGDAQFAIKAQQRLNSLKKQQKTVVLVSHNKNELELQEKYLFLNSGKLDEVSTKKNALAKYFEKAVYNEASFVVSSNHAAIINFSNYAINAEIKPLKIALFQGDNFNDNNILRTDQSMTLQIAYEKLSSQSTIDVLISIANAQGDIILSSSPFVQNDFSNKTDSGITNLVCEIPSHFFNSQIYVLHVWFLKGVKHTLETVNAQALLSSNNIDVVCALKNVLMFKPLYYKNGLIYDLSTINIQGALLPAFNWTDNEIFK